MEWKKKKNFYEKIQIKLGGGVKGEKVETICPFTKIEQKQTQHSNRMREKDTPYYCLDRKNNPKFLWTMIMTSSFLKLKFHNRQVGTNHTKANII